MRRFRRTLPFRRARSFRRAGFALTLCAIRRVQWHPECHRSFGVPGRMVHDDLEPDQAQSHPVGQFFYVIGFGEFQAAEQLLPRAEREALGRIAEQCAVVRVDVGGYALGPAHRGDRPDVVDVTVREQDSGGPEPVLGEDLLDAGLGVLAGVDDHAFFTGRGRDYITVGRERTGREPCDKHKRPFSRYGVSGYRGDPHGREPVTKGACPGIWQVRFANDREHCGDSGGEPGACPRVAIRGMHRVRRPASREYQR